METREVTKLLWRDMTSSNDDFTSYGRSIKLISTKQRPIWWTTKPLIYIPKERRYKSLSTKEDRQPRNDFRCSSSQVTNQIGTYTAFPAKKTLSTIMEVPSDKRLQFQVNWLNIARDTSIKARTKNSSQILNFSFLP